MSLKKEDLVALVLLSRRIGLRATTVQNLYESGWVYTEEINKPPRWDAPITQMQEGKARS